MSVIILSIHVMQLIPYIFHRCEIFVNLLDIWLNGIQNPLRPDHWPKPATYMMLSVSEGTCKKQSTRGALFLTLRALFTAWLHEVKLDPFRGSRTIEIAGLLFGCRESGENGFSTGFNEAPLNTITIFYFLFLEKPW